MVEVRLSSTGDPSRGRLPNRQPNEGVLGDDLGGLCSGWLDWML